MHVLPRLRGQATGRTVSQLRRCSCLASDPARSGAGHAPRVDGACVQAARVPAVDPPQLAPFGPPIVTASLPVCLASDRFETPCLSCFCSDAEPTITLSCAWV